MKLNNDEFYGNQIKNLNDSLGNDSNKGNDDTIISNVAAYIHFKELEFDKLINESKNVFLKCFIKDLFASNDINQNFSKITNALNDYGKFLYDFHDKIDNIGNEIIHRNGNIDVKELENIINNNFLYEYKSNGLNQNIDFYKNIIRFAFNGNVTNKIVKTMKSIEFSTKPKQDQLLNLKKQCDKMISDLSKIKDDYPDYYNKHNKSIESFKNICTEYSKSVLSYCIIVKYAGGLTSKRNALALELLEICQKI